MNARLAEIFYVQVVSAVDGSILLQLGSAQAGTMKGWQFKECVSNHLESFSPFTLQLMVGTLRLDDFLSLQEYAETEGLEVCCLQHALRRPTPRDIDSTAEGIGTNYSHGLALGGTRHSAH